MDTSSDVFMGTTFDSKLDAAEQLQRNPFLSADDTFCPKKTSKVVKKLF